MQRSWVQSQGQGREEKEGRQQEEGRKHPLVKQVRRYEEKALKNSILPILTATLVTRPAYATFPWFLLSSYSDCQVFFEKSFSTRYF